MVEVISSPEEIKSVISKRNKEKLKMHESSTDFTAYFLVLLIIAISILTYPENWESKVEIQHVWYYGWITAIATGAGVIPFFFLTDPNKFWMGISNGKQTIITIDMFRC